MKNTRISPEFRFKSRNERFKLFQALLVYLDKSPSISLIVIISMIRLDYEEFISRESDSRNLNKNLYRGERFIFTRISGKDEDSPIFA